MKRNALALAIGAILGIALLMVWNSLLKIQESIDFGNEKLGVILENDQSIIKRLDGQFTIKCD